MPDPFGNLTLKGMDAVRGALRSFDAPLQRALKKTVKMYGESTKGLIAFLAPVDTYFMQKHAEVRFTPKGYSYEAGYFADTFEENGKRFYPPYQEFGTVNHGAQPSVGPAYEDQAPLFRADVERLILESVQRAAARRAK